MKLIMKSILVISVGIFVMVGFFGCGDLLTNPEPISTGQTAKIDVNGTGNNTEVTFCDGSDKDEDSWCSLSGTPVAKESCYQFGGERDCMPCNQVE